MKKNNYNLEYYSQYDYIQRNNQISLYNSGKINKIEVTFIENNNALLDSTEEKKFSKKQLSSFLSAYLLNGYFPKMRKVTNDSNFCLNYSYTNQEEIISFLKYIYLECMSQDLKKNIKFSFDDNYSYIKLSLPLTKLLKIQEISNYLPIDIVNTNVFFQFKLNYSIKNKNQLNNVFPFWIND